LFDIVFELYVCVYYLQAPQESYQTGLLSQNIPAVCVGVRWRHRHRVSRSCL